MDGCEPASPGIWRSRFSGRCVTSERIDKSRSSAKFHIAAPHAHRLGLTGAEANQDGAGLAVLLPADFYQEWGGRWHVDRLEPLRAWRPEFEELAIEAHAQ